MNIIKRSLLASLALALSLPALASADLPFIITGTIGNAPDGTSAAGMQWSAWSDAAPRVRLSGRLGDGVVGAVRPGAFYGDIGSDAARVGGQWTVLVQGRIRGRSYVAITRGSLDSHPAVFAPATLTLLPSTVMGVDLSRLSIRSGNVGDPVSGGLGEMATRGDRMRRGVQRPGSQPLSICASESGVVQVVADEPSLEASCLPLLRAPSSGTLSR